MSSLMISTNAVRAKVDELRQKNGEFVNLANGMTERVSTLCQMWEGDARDAFLKNYGNSTQQFDAFSKGIEQYCAALEAMAQEHDTNEATNADIANAKA